MLGVAREQRFYQFFFFIDAVVRQRQHCGVEVATRRLITSQKQ